MLYGISKTGGAPIPPPQLQRCCEMAIERAAELHEVTRREERKTSRGRAGRGREGTRGGQVGEWEEEEEEIVAYRFLQVCKEALQKNEEKMKKRDMDALRKIKRADVEEEEEEEDGKEKEADDDEGTKTKKSKTEN
eukprot:749385-Hanusia_phi.AAC.1